MTAALNPNEKQTIKRQRIMDAALEVFSQVGFAGASMDVIALAANVSKPTLYTYFGSKERLFEAIMLSGRDEVLQPFENSSHDLVSDLLTFAWRYAGVVMKPQFLSLARLIIAEAQRFPAIGRAYQKAGPDRVLKGIMTYLCLQRKNGRLIFNDAELAAQDLWALILSAPRTQALTMPDKIPKRPAIARYLINGLTIFLKAYSNNPKDDIKRLMTLNTKNAFKKPGKPHVK